MRGSLLIALLGLISCGKQEADTLYVEPKIPRGKIIPLLVDLHTLEAHYKRLYSREDVYKTALDSASEILLKNHGITKAEYGEALIQYTVSADTMYTIYEAALDTVTIRLSAM